jgi:DNA-binding transcriptional MerR regulator
MIGEMDGLMTIGDFAARCGLSPKVLRTYADVGLLVPSSVDPASAYRYYNTEQLAEAAIVALLRRAGVPVADIARFLTAPSVRRSTGGRSRYVPRSMRGEMPWRRSAPGWGSALPEQEE